MKTFVEIIEQWPSTIELAGDLDEKPETVRKWKTRKRIPSHRWLQVSRAAQLRGIDLTVNDIALASELKVA